MSSTLRQTPTRSDGDAPREWLLASSADPDAFEGEPYPSIGSTVRRKVGGKAWLVVDHDIDRIIVPRWPMRLWRVGEVDAAPAADQPSSWYTRASSLRVLEELPAWSLFGPHGWKVAEVIERARNLTATDAAALSRLLSDDGSSIVDAAWVRWRMQASTAGTPVGHGLLLVSTAVQEAAKAIDPALFTLDPEEGTTFLSDPTWVRAGWACHETALALGAPDLFSTDEVHTLTASWRDRLGLPSAEPPAL